MAAGVGVLVLLRAILLDALLLLRMALQIPVTAFTAMLLAVLVQLRVV